MSQEGYVFGCIIGAGSAYLSEFAFVTLHNFATIAKLPKFVGMPQVLVAQSIFNVPFYDFAHDRNMYRHQMITFGMSVNHFDMYLEAWIIQFEDLLRQLYWSKAYAYVTAEFYLDHEEYRWEAILPDDRKDPPEPTNTWTFEGGPRGFRNDAPIW